MTVLIMAHPMHIPAQAEPRIVEVIQTALAMPEKSFVTPLSMPEKISGTT
jgi:hypothetical protein